MDRNRFGKSLVLALAGLLLVPLAASAQSSIVGLVRDESGGVLPGVTVEAASPVLIEKVRTVVTNEQGRYSIVDVRPGTYRVSFTLPGFATVVRSGIELPSAFTATVNADLKVGSLEESITVSGAAPMVDVQQATRTQVLTRDVIDTLPTTRNIMSVGMLVPGVRIVTPDVGGTMAMTQNSPKVHGVDRPESVQMIDGMSVQTNEDCVCQVYQDDALAAEISVTTSAIPADVSGGGLRTNSIPKDGGNVMSGAVFMGGSDGNWQSENVDDYLRSRNLRAANSVTHIQTFNAAMGGPVNKDTLWYFMTARHISADQAIANVPEEYIVAPDGEIIRAINDQYIRNAGLRLTWQVNTKNKLGLYFQRNWKRLGKSFSYGTDPRAAGQRDPAKAMNGMGTGKWTTTASSRLMVEVGYSTALQNFKGHNQYGPPLRFIADRTDPRFIAWAQKNDTALNVNPECAYAFGCTTWMSTNEGRTKAERKVWSAAMSYVTGTHNFKVGFQDSMGPDDVQNQRNGDLIANYNNNRPSTVTVYNTPVDQKTHVDHDLGIYAQDSWTIKRLTLNPGLRVEWLSASASEVSNPAGRFAPARFYAEREGLPDFNNDIAPRLSAAYDLFGDGRTALKASASRYYRQITGYWAKRYADSGQSTDSRNWFDCDINAAGTGCSGVALPTNNDNIAQVNEIGPSSSTTFGLRSDRNPDPGIQRENNWEYSAVLQHQIRSGMSVSFGWYHRSWREIETTDRTLISAADYTSFQTPMPSFANDPTLAGKLDPNERLTIYNLNRAKKAVYGAALIDRTSQDKSVYDGFEISFNTRFPWGTTLFGGWTVDRNLSTFCTSDDDPNGPTINDKFLTEPVSNGGRFCDQTKWDVPFRQEFKLAGNLPLLYGFDMGAVLQSYGGRARNITWNVPASLFPGGRTNAETILVSEPDSVFQPRYTQLDVNFKKNFRQGQKTFSLQVDLFNALNSNVIMTTTDAIGGSLGNVNSIIVGRLPRIAFQVKW